MKILVTGGNGFIGRHVVKVLEERGFDPFTFDHHAIGGGLGFYGDIRDATAVSEAMHHAEGFIHLAAALGTQETIGDPWPGVNTNIIGGLNVLEAAAKYSVPGVNIAVGNHWMPNTYAITKSTVERFIEMYNLYRSTVVNSVRAMNAYGPGQVAAAPYGPSKVRKIIPSFACRALSGHPVEVYGNGSQISDMVYVGDVALALVLALEKSIEGTVLPRTVEVGPASHNTVLEVAQSVIAAAGSESEIVFLPMRAGETPGRPVTADVETLWQIGMDPSDLTSLDAGLTETVDYFRQYLGGIS